MTARMGPGCGSGGLSVATRSQALQGEKAMCKSIPTKVLCELTNGTRCSIWRSGSEDPLLGAMEGTAEVAPYAWSLAP
jgi:DNA polymerase III psi subunit